MTLTKAARLLGIVLVASTLYGCKDKEEGAAILPTIDQYFPDSAIFKFNNRVLWIQTHVNGISGKVAATIFAQACQQASKSFGNFKINVAEELQFDGRSILIIGFKNFCIACDLRDGNGPDGNPRGTIMTWQQAPSWFVQHVGYMPTTQQIFVERLADIQNTPKGQSMNLETLAEDKAQLKARELGLLRDMESKQELEEEKKDSPPVNAEDQSAGN
jgi:hypothetical protein